MYTFYMYNLYLYNVYDVKGHVDMDYSAISSERKIQIATNVLLLQNYGLDLDDFKNKDVHFSFNEDSKIYNIFDDIYAELGYTLNLEYELRSSNINCTTDLIELMFKSNY